MSEVGLAVHPDKTRIGCCQDARRRGSHEHVVHVPGGTGSGAGGPAR